MRNLIKIVVFDFDNVLIDGEAIDEIGKVNDVEQEVAEITAKAMQGELEFGTALHERAELLKGVSIDDINETVNKLTLMEGAVETISALKEKGYKIACISGSFDTVVNAKNKDLNMDFVITNTLGEDNGVLDGTVTGDLITGDKADILAELLEKEGLTFEECVAIGDGATDIKMLKAAKLGIAFNAKDIVKNAADAIVETKNLKDIMPLILSLDGSQEAPEEEVELEPVQEEIEEEIETTEETVTEEVEKEEATEETVSEEEVEKEEATEEVADSETVEEKPKETKKSRKEIDEEESQLVVTTENAQQLKDEKEELIAEITKERDDLNKKAKEARIVRDKLNNELKENLNIAIEHRDQRNKTNKEVEENKKHRDSVNTDLRKLEWNSGKKDRQKIESEIKKIDKIIETRVLDIKKENQLVKNANDLRKKLNAIHEDESKKDEADELKKVSEEYHTKVVELSEEAQKCHEKMLEYFRKTDEIRTTADEAHKEFITYRKAASKKHDEFKVVLKDIHKINKVLGKVKSGRRETNKQNSRKKNREEKEKAEELFEKFKAGHKVSTEELLLLQKYNIG